MDYYIIISLFKLNQSNNQDQFSNNQIKNGFQSFQSDKLFFTKNHIQRFRLKDARFDVDKKLSKKRNLLKKLMQMNYGTYFIKFNHCVVLIISWYSLIHHNNIIDWLTIIVNHSQTFKFPFFFLYSFFIFYARDYKL